MRASSFLPQCCLFVPHRTVCGRVLGLVCFCGVPSVPRQLSKTLQEVPRCAISTTCGQDANCFWREPSSFFCEGQRRISVQSFFPLCIDRSVVFFPASGTVRGIDFGLFFFRGVPSAPRAGMQFSIPQQELPRWTISTTCGQVWREPSVCFFESKLNKNSTIWPF